MSQQIISQHSSTNNKRKSKLRQLPRQWKILMQLENNHFGLSAMQMAEAVDCEVRTIYRDLEALQEAGFPMITEQKGKESKWKLFNPDRKFQTIPMTEKELQALNLSCKLMKKLEGTELSQAMDSAYQKIHSTLKPAEAENLESFAENIQVSYKRKFNTVPSYATIQSLNLAMESNQIIQMRYKSLGSKKATERRIHPYQLWIHEGEKVYLIAYCEMRKSFRTFYLQRILSFDVLEESFERDPLFHCNSYLQSSFEVMTGKEVHIEVQFPPFMESFLQEQSFHPSQKLSWTENGDIVVSFDVSGVSEIKKWILSHGIFATVLEPSSLREEIKKDLQTCLQKYNS